MKEIKKNTVELLNVADELEEKGENIYVEKIRNIASKLEDNINELDAKINDILNKIKTSIPDTTKDAK